MRNVLNDIEIRNFRAFKDLQVEHLGNVNLIVGNNSVGKTCFLEAIRVFASRNFSEIWETLSVRNEGLYPGGVTDKEMFNNRLSNLRYLFNGRHDIYLGETGASIGEISSRVKRVQFTLELPFSADFAARKRKYIPEPDSFDMEELRPVLTLQIGANRKITDHFKEPVPPDTGIESINSVFISAAGLDNDDLESLWGAVVLTDNEIYLIRALKIVNSNITNLSFIKRTDLRGIRIPYISVENLENPVPLESLGDGLGRLFGLSLAIINSQNGFLLVDEIGSGLHFSVQLDMWRMIFAISSELNVQVFATTHSNDCIRAFQIAANESKLNGVLLRLERREEMIVPIVFDEERLSIATQEDLEVR